MSAALDTGAGSLSVAGHPCTGGCLVAPGPYPRDPPGLGSQWCLETPHVCPHVGGQGITLTETCRAGRGQCGDGDLAGNRHPWLDWAGETCEAAVLGVRGRVFPAASARPRRDRDVSMPFPTAVYFILSGTSGA